MQKPRLKLFLILPVIVVAACAPGDDGAVRQAKQECRALGHAAATAAFDTCVAQVAERIYISWGRDLQISGD